MITLRTGSATYWGESGQYGPFDEQTEGEWAGWPNFGQVVRYFREKAGYSPQEFAIIYGKETNKEGPITGRQVSRMELENEVPTNINRRKLIARLLNIPPMLLGLATLEPVTLKPHLEVKGAVISTGHIVLPKVVADTAKYQVNIRTFITLHYTSEVQSRLNQINIDIRELESLEKQSNGDLRYHIRELLFSYYLLAAKVVRDQQHYSQSYCCANQAVRVAKAENDIDMTATALYTRGRTYLEWGMYGTFEKGTFQVQESKINKAIHDFEEAKNLTKDTEKELHPQIAGRIDMHLSRAYAIYNLNAGKEVPDLVFAMLNSAEENADRDSINDPYERELVTGSQVGFAKGEYLNTKVRALTIAGRPETALTELTKLESLRYGRIGKHLTRNQIWLDIVAADVYMGIEEFEWATKRATRALAACRDINSVGNFTHIVDIHGRLLKSAYKAESDVAQLGDMIDETLTAHIEY